MRYCPASRGSCLGQLLGQPLFDARQAGVCAGAETAQGSSGAVAWSPPRRRGSSARSCCSCTAMASAHHARCASTRPTAEAVQLISENPYRLARDIRGIGFRTDQIFVALGPTEISDTDARPRALEVDRAGVAVCRMRRQSTLRRNPKCLLRQPLAVIATRSQTHGLGRIRTYNLKRSVRCSCRYRRLFYLGQPQSRAAKRSDAAICRMSAELAPSAMVIG